MTLYASKTPRDLNRDPLPYVISYNDKDSHRVPALYAGLLYTPFDNNITGEFVSPEDVPDGLVLLGYYAKKEN